MKDPCKWYRRTALELSRRFFTPVDFWLGRTVKELVEWIKTAVEINEVDK